MQKFLSQSFLLAERKNDRKINDNKSELKAKFCLHWLFLED